MTDTTRDDEELMRVFDYARNHPENWDQNYYRGDSGSETPDCGTTYCLAGFKTWVFDQNPVLMVSDVEPEMADYDSVLAGVYHDGKFISCFDYAKQQLGLNMGEACALFLCTSNDTDVVEGVVKNIMNDEYRETE